MASFSEVVNLCQGDKEQGKKFIKENIIEYDEIEKEVKQLELNLRVALSRKANCFHTISMVIKHLDLSTPVSIIQKTRIVIIYPDRMEVVNEVL